MSRLRKPRATLRRSSISPCTASVPPLLARKQEWLTPLLQGRSEATISAVGHEGNEARTCSAIRPPRARSSWWNADRRLLSGLPRDEHLVVALVGSDRGVEPSLLSLGKAFTTASQDRLDAVQRIAGVVAVAAGLGRGSWWPREDEKSGGTNGLQDQWS